MWTAVREKINNRQIQWDIYSVVFKETHIYHDKQTTSINNSSTIKKTCTLGNKAIKLHLMCVTMMNIMEPPQDKTNKMTVRPVNSSALASAQSDQSLCCAFNGKLRTQAFSMRTAKTLIRLGGCPGWSESLLGAHAIFIGFVMRRLYGHLL